MTYFPLKAVPAFTSLTFPAGLQGLVNGGTVLSTGKIDASALRYDEIHLEITLNTLSPSGVPLIDAALVPSWDGSNFHSLAGGTFPIGSDSVPVASANIDIGNAAKLAYIFLPVIRPYQYKVILRNATGVPFNVSGNSVKYSGTVRETA